MQLVLVKLKSRKWGHQGSTTLPEQQEEKKKDSSDNEEEGNSDEAAQGAALHHSPCFNLLQHDGMIWYKNHMLCYMTCHSVYNYLLYQMQCYVAGTKLYISNAVLV